MDGTQHPSSKAHLHHHHASHNQQQQQQQFQQQLHNQPHQQQPLFLQSTIQSSMNAQRPTLFDNPSTLPLSSTPFQTNPSPFTQIGHSDFREEEEGEEEEEEGEEISQTTSMHEEGEHEDHGDHGDHGDHEDHEEELPSKRQRL